MAEEWTLDELVARVAAVLDAGGYPGAPNGRVREMPDRRAIRWYATRGLLDRPAGHRGRVATYGPRHLLQLVAIKRRQAEGRSLAQIQAELAGATDATLREIAALPAGEPAAAGAGGAVAPPAARPAFWTLPPATPAPRVPDAPGGDLLTGVPLGDGVTLLLAAAPDPDDVVALRAAARPLLDLLATRGLLPDSVHRRSAP